jgi:MFS family permease
MARDHGQLEKLKDVPAETAPMEGNVPGQVEGNGPGPAEKAPAEEIVSTPANPPLFTRAFITLFFMNFTVFMGLDMMLAPMPLYLQDNMMTEAQIGVIFGGVYLASIFIRFWAGRLVTVVKPLWLLRGAFICTALGNAVFLLVDHFFNYFGSRVIFGLGLGLSSTMVVTLTSSIIPPRRMGEGLSFLALGASIALTVGPLIGITMLERYGFVVVLGTVISVFVLGSVLGFTLREERFPVGTAFKERPPLIPDKEVLAAAGLIFFLGMSTCGIFTYLVLYLDEISLRSIVARFFTVTACSIVLTRLFGGRINDRLGHLFIVLPTSCLVIISELILFFFPGPRTIILAAICFGLGLGALLPSLQALAINAAPATKRTGAAAAFLNGYDIGQASGFVLLGFLSELFSSYLYVYIATPIFMVALILYYSVSPLFNRGKRIKAS